MLDLGSALWLSAVHLGELIGEVSRGELGRSLTAEDFIYCAHTICSLSPAHHHPFSIVFCPHGLT